MMSAPLDGLPTQAALCVRPIRLLSRLMQAISLELHYSHSDTEHDAHDT